MSFRPEAKVICWRPKQALIECVVKTKCFEEMGEIEPCISATQCHLERKNWVLCKTNALNPRYRLRGNPYDVASDDQKKIEARDERIKARMRQEEGLKD
jgi:cytochrome c oxidase assembly factor 5